MDLSDYALEKLRCDAGLSLWRGRKNGAAPVLMLCADPGAGAPQTSRLERELALGGELDADWAVLPLSIDAHFGERVLLLSDPGGHPLASQLDRSRTLQEFLTLAIGLVHAVGRLHQRGVIHRDLHPGNILVDDAGTVFLTGFGLASRSQHEWASEVLQDGVAGSLAYMAPEQTGRMNRAIDARSDLYGLGVTLYQLLTGALPFQADDPIQWIHCHVARTPQPPSQRRPGVPPQIDAIILKLMSKAAEDRYQTASGLEHDLRRCLETSLGEGGVEPFTLGALDRPDRLVMPQRLYGRSAQTRMLADAFHRVADRGEVELVLVTGPAGSGKSSLVNELQQTMAVSGGAIASGKADPHRTSVPYATLAQAIQQMVRRLLSKDNRELTRWRSAILDAVGGAGALLVGLAPELALIIGPQVAVAPLSPHDEKVRFQSTLRRFLGVFGEPGAPLTLFLDDLQWLDSATLDLLVDLVVDAEMDHVLIVGAYRDDEVDAHHPLAAALATLRTAGRGPRPIALAPLDASAIEALLDDALRGPARALGPLARLIREKTGGNPFFVIQLLKDLRDEGLLRFDADEGTWTWQEEGIRAKAISDNVADLLARRLDRLPIPDKALIRQLACLGPNISPQTLSIVLALPQPDHAVVLRQAVADGFVTCREGAYSLVHDRVQEAAYALITPNDRVDEHLRIGRVLLGKTPADERDDRIFEILGHFERGAAQLDAREHEQVAALCLRAGQLARQSTAYVLALVYLERGWDLLGADPWARGDRLAFDLAFHRAECEFLTGAQACAEARLRDLAQRAAGRVDGAMVARLRLALYTTMGAPEHAVEVGLAYLRDFGIEWPGHPAPELLEAEVADLRAALGARPIESLADLPKMADPEWLAAMDILASLILPAQLTDSTLEDMVLTRIANLSLQHGNCDASCYAYASLNVVLGVRLGDYQAGVRFGELACDLVERQGLDRFKARVYTGFSTFVAPWGRHLPTCLSLARQAFDAANAVGDLVFGAASARTVVDIQLVSGHSLSVIQSEAERTLAYSRGAKFPLAIDAAISQLLLVQELRGAPAADVGGGGLANIAFEEYLDAGGSGLALQASWYWIHQMQARVVAGDAQGALQAAGRARALLPATRSFLATADYHFFAGVIEAIAHDLEAPSGRAARRAALAGHAAKLEAWAGACAENFGARAAILQAEAARLDGRHLEAERRFEDAIAMAHRYGFMQDEALAHELAARYHAGRDLPVMAGAYLRGARTAYAQWGADAKVRSLEQRHADLGEGAAMAREAAPPAIDTRVDHLDAVAVMKMSQAVSGELVLDALVERLMRIVVEHAGAVRGLLLLPRADTFQIVAEALTGAQGVTVLRRSAVDERRDLPESVLHYVMRSHETVLLDDARVADPYAADPYVARAAPRSILCLPLIKQGELQGILYLENDLSPNAFTPAQIAVLRLLASQAAISLENANLYTDLQRTQDTARKAEHELRRALDSIPALVWTATPTGEIETANKPWHDFTGVAPEEMTGEIWMDTYHLDDIGEVVETWKRMLVVGEPDSIAARMRRADGAYRTFLVRASPARDAEGAIEKWYGTNIDIDEQVRGETALREAQAALARAGRLTAMGELTVSIAHEMNQPLMAIVTNAATCLRWLRDGQSSVEEARRAAERIVRDGHRAGEVLSSIRALAKKSSPELTPLDLNEALLEVLELMRSELARHGVQVETALRPDANDVVGNRVQLQQVMLNLLLNAIDAMTTTAKGPRRLVVSSHLAEPGVVEVRVADSGVGIDPADSQIFEAFVTSKPDGIGMGLSICRSIIEGHGGRLWATPNSPRGSVFHFSVLAIESASPA